MGLFTGMSVISFFELPFWMIKILVALFFGKRMNKWVWFNCQPPSSHSTWCKVICSWIQLKYSHNLPHNSHYTCILSVTFFWKWLNLTVQTPVISLQSQNCVFSGTLCIKILWSLFMYCIYLQLKWNKLFTIIYKFNKRLALSTFVCILGRSGNLFWFSDFFFYLFPILCNSWSPRLLRNKRKTFISPVKKNTLTFGCGIEIQGI